LQDATPSQRRFPRWALVIAGITLLIALAYAVDASPWLRGGNGWRWEYLPAPLGRAILLAAALIVYVGVGLWLLRRTSPAWPVLLWGFTGTVVLSLCAAYVREGDVLYLLFSRTISLQASSEWWIGANVDWNGGEWRDWLSVMSTLGAQTSNAATSPPGMPMLYGLTTSLFERWPTASDSLYRILLPTQCANFDLLQYSSAQWASAWLGIFTPVMVALGVLPLYAISRWVTTPSAARLPVLWWPLVPGLLSFLTSSSTVFPLIVLVIFYLLLRGLDARVRWPWIVGAGLLYGIGLFFNFIFLPLAALYGFYTLLHYAFKGRTTGQPWWTPLRVGLAFGIGTILPWLLFFLLTGESFFDILSQALGTHLALDRPYGYWLWMHVWDWALWSGIGLALVWLWGVFRWLRRRDSEPPLIAITLLLTILAFTISGTTRGESGRIWLVLSPFVLLSAVELRKSTSESLRSFGWITAAQAICTLVLTVVIAANNAPDVFPTPPQPPVLSVQRPTDALFSGSSGHLYRLTGWDAQSNTDSITLSLNWQALQRPDQPQWFSAILVSPDGEAATPFEWQPGGLDTAPRYPTTCWTPNTVIGDQVDIPLPDDAEPGAWYLSLSAYGDDALAEGRLNVTQANTAPDIQIGLGPIRVGE
jgi:hypothetical protein